MIKFFEYCDFCHIIIEPKVDFNDLEVLKTLLEKDFSFWHIEFGRVYMIDEVFIKLLYNELYNNNKDIKITTHKNKLNHYLRKLGFQTTFKSLVTKDIVSVDAIEIVLIGGSADSTDKIINIIKNTTIKKLTYIIVQHIDENQKLFFDQILQKYTDTPTLYAKENQKIKKGYIYIAPKNIHLEVLNGYFNFNDAPRYNYSKPSISMSYKSFSSYYKEKLLVIHECGYLGDGIDQLELLKENNTKLIIQDITECKAKDMIKNALKLKTYDYMLNIKDIISFLNLVDNNLSKSESINLLLEEIYKKYAYDFRLYNRDMISRRVDVFVAKHNINSIKDTMILILFNRSAFKVFFLEVSINVTEFFRDPKSFKNSIEVLDRFYKHNSSLKIWSAGCSSGEEIYSIAIILDILNLLKRSVLYATDFNNVILEEAKNGLYTKKSFDLANSNFNQLSLNQDLKKYFKSNNSFLEMDEKIKEKTLFFHHNLVEDSSFNEFDIIICKNVIIYFEIHLQERIFKLFYDSLKFGGHLVLGESESLPTMFKSKFKQCRDDCKIFKKVM